MEGANHIDFESGGFFQEGLHLSAIFAHDIGIIATGFIGIVVMEIYFIGEDCTVEGAEVSECVCREEGAGGGIVGDHDFRPVHHGSHDEVESVFARGEGIVFGDDEGFGGGWERIELFDEIGGELVEDEGDIGMEGEDGFDGGGVIRLDMLEDEIVERAAV